MDFISDRLDIVGIAAGIAVLIIIIAAVLGSKKKRAAANTGAAQSSGREVNILAGAVSKKNINYDPVIEITRAITDNDQPTVDKMRLLARNYPDFVTQHQSWCDSVVRTVNAEVKDALDRNDKDALVKNFFAHWLSGYSMSSGETSPSGKFGCYITGKETPKDLIEIFERIDRTLNYGLEFKNISLAGVTTVTQLIPMVNSTLAYKRYSLISFETGTSPGFYLFIAPMKDHDKITDGANKVDFRIYRQIMV